MLRRVGCARMAVAILERSTPVAGEYTMFRPVAVLAFVASATLFACDEERPVDAARADAEMLARGGTYKRLYDLQFRE